MTLRRRAFAPEFFFITDSPRLPSDPQHAINSPAASPEVITLVSSENLAYAAIRLAGIQIRYQVMKQAGYCNLEARAHLCTAIVDHALPVYAFLAVRSHDSENA